MSNKRQKRHFQSANNIINFQPQNNNIKILPRNKNQESYMLKLMDPKKDIVFGIGPAGTGETLLAVQVAVKLFQDGVVDKIVVTRPAVSVDEDLGFLPGTLEQKMAPWTMPIFDVFRESYNTSQIQGMINENVIEIAPLAYMRGRTFKKAFIIADEMQNATVSQMKMLLTRLGLKSQMAVTGDLHQADRLASNGLLDFIKQLEGYRQTTHLDVVRFHQSDIERHNAVREVLQVYGDE